jgi:hypothetical protein
VLAVLYVHTFRPFKHLGMICGECFQRVSHLYSSQGHTCKPGSVPGSQQRTRSHQGVHSDRGTG